MEFGPIPVAHAQGTILAHSLKLGSRRLRKGTKLDTDDITSLREAGYETVTVARLAASDVHEDLAAEDLATCLISLDDAGVRATAPFTGRVNILATAPGLARIDAAKLLALNLIDPMISCATVAPMTRMSAGGMIATVKIISYAVETDILRCAREVVAGAIGLIRPELQTARLIVTSTTTDHKSTAGVSAIKGRLNALDVALKDVVHVPHEEVEIAKALQVGGVDLVLLLTGSATSDPKDTGPEALRLAGGVVERFGMPVDPGNLLFLGDLEAIPVIGLPGCARSPALNGADWILERVICGVQVTHRDIASMGVGGLLKEIPQRPQPRRGS